MSKPTISKFEAYELAKKAGIKFHKDFYQQDRSAVGELVEIAKREGYQKPANANGSRGRYFFYHLQKLMEKHGWK